MTIPSTIASTWSSPHSGWYKNSQLSTDLFTPTREGLIFGHILNSPATHWMFICAFFTPNVAVDSMGRILLVPKEHFDAIAGLALQTVDLPDTVSFRNTWRVKHDRSDQNIRSLLVKMKDEEKMRTTSVYGYEKGNEMLENEVQGMTTLPPVLMELFGLLEEAKQGYEKGKEDTGLIGTVKALLSN
ncbi:hypothetical protein K439DRAFT_1390347 [Ramaria rubella]|nr:hypothetical protein K439DRAFT_1390347 [Ramaria rubella]